MLDMAMSAGSTFTTFSPALTVGTSSLADELEGEFEEISLSPISDTAMEPMEGPQGSPDEMAEGFEDVVLEECTRSTTAQGHSEPMTVADNTDADSTSTLVEGDDGTPVAKTALDSAFKESKFVEHLRADGSGSQPVSVEDNSKLLAWKYNRELIGRKADGFFEMETVPSAQQSEGIAALQRTLAPGMLSDAASSGAGSSQVSSSLAVLDSDNRPTLIKKITFAKPRGRIHDKGHVPSSATSRSKVAPNFSLGRDLVLAGIQRRVAEPSAPARFVRLPTDPAVSFTRRLNEHGLKIQIPETALVNEEGVSASVVVTSPPDLDSAGNHIFKHDKPKLYFGTPRQFLENQCVEESCPIRFAHAKGPYHHKGHRDHTLMTGLFGHSNPPPEIWNLYRNMVETTTTCDREPRLSAREKADQDLVIAFATFHYGDLSDVSGDEFHRRYAGKHMASKVSLAVRAGSTTSSSIKSFSSCLGRWK